MDSELISFESPSKRDHHHQRTSPLSLFSSNSFHQSYDYNQDENDVDFEDIILLPSPVRRTSNEYTPSDSIYSNDRTPLIAQQRRQRSSTTTTQRRIKHDTPPAISKNRLFGFDNINWHKQEGDNLGGRLLRQLKEKRDQDLTFYSSLKEFFFGFMFEQPLPEQECHLEPSPSHVWTSPIILALSWTYALSNAAATVPITLTPSIAQHFLVTSSYFAPKAAASAVLGSACGKFCTGPAGDILGARRTSLVFTFLLGLSLVLLASSWSQPSCLWGFFLVDFCQSVQWPCMIVLLATHFSNQKQLEEAIMATTVAGRLGSLLSIPVASLLLHQDYCSWRLVTAGAVLTCLLASTITLVFLRDSPERLHEPQNPINTVTIQEYMSYRQTSGTFSICASIQAAYKLLCSIFTINLVPSLSAVLRSGTFWIVAIAHAGDSMVRSAERVLGTYYMDTSLGMLTEQDAAGFAVFLPLGGLVGLAIAGNLYTRATPRRRKRMVSRLYMLAIVSCYALSILAIPNLRTIVNAPDLILYFQVMFTFLMGCGGVSIHTYIPGIVGASFGKRNKGLFAAYVDGIACGLASLVWRVVEGAVHDGSHHGGGWAYAWAAVALLVILCAILMAEFMESYFVKGKGGRGGSSGRTLYPDSPSSSRGYETIIFV